MILFRPRHSVDKTPTQACEGVMPVHDNALMLNGSVLVQALQAAGEALM